MLRSAAALTCVLALVVPALASAREPAPLSMTKSARKTKKAPKKRITLDLYEADLHNVLRLFADVSGKSFVVADDVQGRVTLKLKDVPWDRALEVILRSQGLGLDVEGDIYRVAPQAELFAEEQRALDQRQLWRQKAPLRTKVIPVNYARAKELVPLVKSLLSERGRVTWDERTNVLIVKDVAGSRVFDED